MSQHQLTLPEVRNLLVELTGLSRTKELALWKKEGGTDKRVRNPRVVQIGKRLFEIGGTTLMREVYVQLVEQRVGTDFLEWSWDGIGSWQH